MKSINLILFIVALLFSFAGCSTSECHETLILNSDIDPSERPTIEAIRVSCNYNFTHEDFVWYFNAWVHYPHHEFEDIYEVRAEVFNIDGDEPIDIYPLFNDDGKYWESSWLEETQTKMWCGIDYKIRFVALDEEGNGDYHETEVYYK